jgi:DNA helicase-2/ATP-dependent DNA helicase PcrA
MDLNPAQLEAVMTLSGPLLVLAGAGTGKTRVVTFRIAELIRRGTRPERILGVTFTNKAADEMRERVVARIGKAFKARPEISTFHSLCVRILRRHARHLGYPPSFAIYDRGDQESVARSVLREIRLRDGLLRPGELIERISRWKMASLGPDEAASMAETDTDHLAAVAYRRYQRALKAAGAFDFDDLLLFTEQLFQRSEAIRREEAARFDHLLIDEYQDTNASQYRIVKALAAGHRNLCVVGDDDQSIYGWRGAEVTHILRFTHDWPDAKVVRLETNYRSTQEILGWANRLIAFNKKRHAKMLRATARGEAPRIVQLPDEQSEAKTVVDEIVERIQSGRRRARDFAILCRTNEQPRPFEQELRRAKVPYVLVGGMSFFDRREVRDVLAYAKVVVNPRDEVSLLRIINTPPRGIGQTAVTRLLEKAVAVGKPFWELLGEAADGEAAGSTQRAIGGFLELVRRYHAQAKDQAPGRVLRSLIDEIGYRDEIARRYDDPGEQQARWASVEELLNAVGAYSQRAERPTLAGFLHEIMVSAVDDDRDKESKLQRDAVALMTLHAAKGLEFTEVYVVGMEEGLLPHQKSIDAPGAAIDEERRLCYVGVTRAKRRLTLTLALGRQKWGKTRPTIPSRFLFELVGRADDPKYAAAVAGKPRGPHRPATGTPRR